MIYTNEQLAACALREPGISQKVYPKRVEALKMTQSKADSEIAMMAAIYQHFRAMAEVERPRLRVMIVRVTQLDGKLPNLALMRISAWHRSRGDEVHFHRKPIPDLDGAAL